MKKLMCLTVLLGLVMTATDQARGDSPTILSEPVLVAQAGSAYMYRLDGIDLDPGDRLCWRIQKAPNGAFMLTIPAFVTPIWNIPEMRYIVWWPQESHAGKSWKFELSLDDGNWNYDVQKWRVFVAPGTPDVPGDNTNPEIVSMPPVLVPNYFYRYPLLATDLEGDQLFWRLEDAPSGAFLFHPDPMRWDRPWVIWYPPPGCEGLEFRFRVVVTDGRGGECRQQWHVTDSLLPTW